MAVRDGTRGGAEARMLGELLIESLIRPRAAARRLFALEIPAEAVAPAAAAAACAGVVLAYAAMVLSGGAVDPVSEWVLRAPILGAAMQLGMMLLFALLTWRVGRLFGGTGGFWDAARLVVWLNVVTLAIQAAQLAALALIPPLAGLIALATLFWLLWAFASFVAELHGFEQPFMVLGVVLLLVVGAVFGLTMIAAILGITPPTGGL